MGAKPEWVPEWVWGEFERHCNEMREAPIDWEDSASVDSLINFLHVLLQDKGCAVVWRAIDRRKGVPTQRHPEHFQLETSSGAPLGTGEADRFFLRLVDAAFGLFGESKITLAERRAIAKRIKLHADALTGVLVELEQRCEGWGLDQFGEYYCTLAHAIADENRKLNADIPDAAARLGAPAYVDGVISGVLAIKRTLQGLGSTAEKWAASTQIVKRPNDENAERLYFIRKMTAHLRDYYGTPLRDAVAALTRSVYKCDMDAATVAKLAP